MKNPIWIIWLVLCLSACGSRTPDYVISEKDMEDLLVDIHKSEAVIESNYNIYNNNAAKKKMQKKKKKEKPYFCGMESLGNSSTRLLYGMGIILKPI